MRQGARLLVSATLRSVPAVGLPEGLGPLGGAVAAADIGAEGPQLAAAVGGGVVLAQIEDAVAQQQLAEAEGGGGGVVGGRVAAGLAQDDPALGRRGARQVTAAARPPGGRPAGAGASARCCPLPGQLLLADQAAQLGRAAAQGGGRSGQAGQAGVQLLLGLLADGPDLLQLAQLAPHLGLGGAAGLLGLDHGVVEPDRSPACQL